MPTYRIEWTEETWNRLEIEAETEEEALELFHMGEFDYQAVKITGGEIQDSIEIEEVEDLDKFDILITRRGMAEEVENV